MTKGLARCGATISFILPKKFHDAQYDWMTVHDASEYALDELDRSAMDERACLEFVKRHRCTLTRGYFMHSSGDDAVCEVCFKNLPSGELAHIDLYSKGAAEVAKRTQFDAIHAHDWMTFPAAAMARHVARQRNKRRVPFIAHIHATEIDRHDGSHIYDVERRGMQAADRIVAVSHYTKSVITKYYGVDPAKISVVHNGIEPRSIPRYPKHPLKRRYKLVLFIGRITYQKGPDYYVRLARKVTDQYANVKFLMIGSGDMQASMVEMAAREGLTGKLLFSSWISDNSVDLTYQMADVFVMPSVSEPFGIVPLEAIQNGTPVVVSKNSGVIEVIKSCVAVDFWDIDKMASAIVTLLKNEPYARNMVEKARDEVDKLTWDLAASKLSGVYEETVKEVAYA